MNKTELGPREDYAKIIEFGDVLKRFAVLASNADAALDAIDEAELAEAGRHRRGPA